MCGLTGFIDWRHQLASPEGVLELMTGTLQHRGPDGHGIWFEPDSGIGLGHRRLSIIDLSPEGHQPMQSASGRYVISFNGEIYNFGEIRAELEQKGQTFRGHSDTEVMLAAFEHWGLEASISRFIGMFAFALWDKKLRSLSLVRDRLGIKPLYYGVVNGMFVFASELKALKVIPGFDLQVDRQAITQLLRYMYIPAPYSIYNGIRKLLPGSILSLDVNAGASNDYGIRSYWSAKDTTEQGATNPYAGTAEDAVEELDYLLRDAIRLRMLADVPLGAFLSGGIDSSTVVALMQSQSSQPIKTFSIGFKEQGYDEAQHASAVARHLGTDHAELYIDPEESMAVIPKLPTLYDEPFADASQIPTFLVSRLARQHVTVSLSGDGGDELFHGYDRYSMARRIWDTFGWMPKSAHTVLGRCLSVASPATWGQLEDFLQNVLHRQYGMRRSADKIHKLSEILSSGHMNREAGLYRALMSHWKQPLTVVMGAQEPDTVFTDTSLQAKLDNFEQSMMYTDTVSYLPDDILVKVDRASMGVSLEARVPLIDHRVVEFASRLPLEMKLRNGQGKWILRQVLGRYVPNNLVDRPKMGFGVPVGAWLRGPLRDWAESLLNAERLHREGYFNPVPIRKKWQEHLEKRHDWSFLLWDVLMFQAWLESH